MYYSKKVNPISKKFSTHRKRKNGVPRIMGLNNELIGKVMPVTSLYLFPIAQDLEIRFFKK
ncbi:MAG: hypothetical protein DRQ57_07855 [Gammaproteobacteria bacterium]|nr:MAG: hypothetical protein DRQ57_07855 [Gammaproteobacteria bacterium]